MGGCTNCKSKSGCDHRKSDMLGAVGDVLERLYPTRTWGQPDDSARFCGGLPQDDCESLAEELAMELDASTFYVPGGEDEYCDYIYVLCVGREPSLVQLRDGNVAWPEEIRPGDSIRELYLRVCLSTMAPLAAVQEVALRLDYEDELWTVCESPRAGVYDAPLLHRMQRLVAILPAYDLLHVDFGEISQPPESFDHGDYSRLYGGAPDVANFLFYPQPSTTIVTTAIR